MLITRPLLSCSCVVLAVSLNVSSLDFLNSAAFLLYYWALVQIQFKVFILATMPVLHIIYYVYIYTGAISNGGVVHETK